MASEGCCTCCDFPQNYSPILFEPLKKYNISYCTINSEERKTTTIFVEEGYHESDLH
jgi:hypothetical protein